MGFRNGANIRKLRITTEEADLRSVAGPTPTTERVPSKRRSSFTKFPGHYGIRGWKVIGRLLKPYIVRSSTRRSIHGTPIQQKKRMRPHHPYSQKCHCLYFHPLLDRVHSIFKSHTRRDHRHNLRQLSTRMVPLPPTLPILS